MSFVTNESKILLKDLIGQGGRVEESKQKVWIGLSTTTPTLAGINFTEPLASTGYQKVLIGNLSTSFSSMCAPAENETGVYTENVEAITFPEATENWGLITHFGLFRGETKETAQLVVFGALQTPINIYKQYIPVFRTGTLKLSLN